MSDSVLADRSYGVYIDGAWQEPEGGRYADIRPGNGETVAMAPDASTGQVDAAIGAARRAFDDGGWSGLDPKERAEHVQQLANALLGAGDDLLALAKHEWGCTENERLFQIDAPAIMALRNAELAAEPVESAIPAWGAAGTTLLRYEPLGVVSVLTPWNFPHTLNAMKVGNALAAGNTVVLKPSPLTPLSALALATIIDEQTDIPAGVVNVVTPSSLEGSELLTTDPRVDMVSFTGSSAVGRSVMAAAARTMKRVLLELGGKSASIILDDADLDDETMARLLFEGCTLHAGQACILNSRLVVPASRHDDIVARLVSLAEKVTVGDPVAGDVDMGPLISADHLERVSTMVDKAVSDGATVATGGHRVDAGAGHFYAPTIVTGVRSSDHIAQEEVFGPVLTVLSYESDDEAVAIANDSQYGLGGAVWGTDTDRALAIARRMRTGQVSINGTTPGDAPFGGFGQSGIGREGGEMGLRTYMEPKAIGSPA
ncbi:aldehyde dehydrogenase family protein [uncultured Williamsia sp.]|uniref:aldehyde dehydrogenase family protein n=1 Tax=uncultured Williamsia sp. TaxID=259311 RepID=UPI002618247C|nr:aldehyde dehydrogenase family protein [uncultured Williamsia sp.]